MSPVPDDTAAQAAARAHDAARDASDAARHARRRVRRAQFRATCDRTPWFFGAVLIALGLIFLLDNLNLIEARSVLRNFWPLAIIAFGVSRLVFGVGGERVFGALATAFGGLWLADRLFVLDINVVGVFWPLILIGLGISMLFRPRRGWSSPALPPVPPVPPLPGATPTGPHAGFAADAGSAAGTTDDAADNDAYVDQSATIREVAILAGIERRNVSQAFRGGSITAMMGSVELDLRDCRMAEPTASIAVQVVMGQVVLRLPANWVVESHLATVLGNLEDRSDRPIDPTPRRLVIDGSVFMGQVEIRS